MKELNFLLICLIVFSITISKDGQKSTNRKETLPTSDKKRTLDNDNYIIVYYSASAMYGPSFVTSGYTIFNQDIPTRSQVSSLTVLGNTGSTNEIAPNGDFHVYPGEGLKIHFNKKISSLKDFFNTKYDEKAVSINSVDFSNFDTTELTDLSGMFYGVVYLGTVNFGNFDGAKITNISEIFSGCNNINYIVLGKFKDSSKVSISNLFSGMKNLNTVNLSSYVGESVTNISAMFSGCIRLTSVDLGSFTGKEVTNINAMFSECNSLESVEFLNFVGSKVTNISAMFSNCTSLKRLIFQNLLEQV